MRVEMLSIGDELLDGRVTDSNAARVGAALYERGRQLARVSVVPDQVEAIVEACKATIGRSTSLCILSGGLGPTTDDLTREAVASLAGLSLKHDPRAWQQITSFFEALGRQPKEGQRKQALLPEGAIRVDNPHGTAPGFDIMVQGCRFISLPGVPHEFSALLQSHVFVEWDKETPLHGTRLRCFGKGEGDIASLVEPVLPADVRVGYRAHFPEIHISLRSDSEQQLDEATKRVRAALGHLIYGDGDASLASHLLNALRNKGYLLATAESCTGGLIGHLITQEPGSSDVYKGGVVAYSNALKNTLLDVPAKLIDAHGAVSEETVRAMGRGVLRRSRADCALVVSGIAGPGGATAEKKVGTTCLGVITPEVEWVTTVHFPYNRRRNKQVSAYVVMAKLLRLLRESEG